MQERNIAEDEIDLKELFRTIWDKKNFIIIFTIIITILSIVFVFFKTPIYQAKALIEIGNYKLDDTKSNSNNDNVLIDDANQLAKKINILYIDMKKNIKDKEVEIVSVLVPKKQTTFVEIISNAISNELAVKEIESILEYIQNEHQEILNDVKKRRELQIANLDRKIDNIKNNELKLLDEKIVTIEKTMDNYKKQLELVDINLKKIENSNSALAALKLMEKRDVSNFILTSNIQLMDLKNKRDRLFSTTLADLEEKKLLVESLLLPHNYKNTDIVGTIIIDDFPIKPKKKLIVIVSFITGLVVSIFIVFFMQFIRSFKEEK